MRSISEYITEQETGVVLESGDTMVRGYIEFASAASLVNYYAEQASLVCFADENGFVMESDGILSKIGGGIKSAWDGFIKFIKGLLGKLASFFKGKQLAKAENDLASLDQNQEITVDCFCFTAYNAAQLRSGYADPLSQFLLRDMSAVAQIGYPFSGRPG